MIIISRRWSDVVDLIAVTEGTDASGFPANVEVVRNELFVNKKDVRSAEFYQAAAQGVRLETMFEVRSEDYQGEEYLNYEGKRYSIERTYDRGSFTELVCQRRGDDHGKG